MIFIIMITISDKQSWAMVTSVKHDASGGSELASSSAQNLLLKDEWSMFPHLSLRWFARDPFSRSPASRPMPGQRVTLSEPFDGNVLSQQGRYVAVVSQRVSEGKTVHHPQKGFIPASQIRNNASTERSTISVEHVAISSRRRRDFRTDRWFSYR